MVESAAAGRGDQSDRVACFDRRGARGARYLQVLLAQWGWSFR